MMSKIFLLGLVLVLVYYYSEACQTRVPSRPSTDPVRFPYYFNNYPYNYYPTLAGLPGRPPRPRPRPRFRRSNQQECGLNSIEVLKHGSNQTRHSWPWLAAVYLNDSQNLSFRCSGVLIDSRSILTSANCLVGLSAQQLVVSVGSQSGFYLVDNLSVHQDFETDKTNDIGLIATNGSFSNFICLPPYSDPTMVLDKILVAVGRENYNSNLVEAEFKLRNGFDECSNVTYQKYCGLAVSQHPEICWNDRATPLMYFSNGFWYLYGISGELACGSTGPVLFTIIPDYLEWIDRQTNFNQM